MSGKRKTLNVFPVEKLSAVHTDDDGNPVVIIMHPDGTELAVQLSPSAADELTGALIERPASGYSQLGSQSSSEQDVSNHSFEQIEPDAYQLQLTGEEGTILTFRMGTRRVRRIRDTMTAHLVRKERGDSSQ